MATLHMVLERSLLRATVGAQVARVGLLPSVSPEVPLEILQLSEGLVAHGAGVLGGGGGGAAQRS